MTDRSFLLEIPVDAWAPEQYVPDAAVEAVELGSRLTVQRNVMDHLDVSCSDLPLAASALNVTATLLYRHDAHSFLTRLLVTVEVLDADDGRIAEISTSATTEFLSDDVLELHDDTAETFALSFGCLEPIWTAARTVASALTFVGVDARVTPDETLEHNRVAIQAASEQPPMSSDDASPLNPYALAGIPGEAAERWAAHGFPATQARRWADVEIEPEAAAWWLDYDFAAEEAAEWRALGYSPEEASECVREGVTADEVAGLEADGIDPFTFYQLKGLVEPDEMVSWLEAINDRDLLDARDVRELIEAGLSSWDVERAPSDLTAGEIIEHHTRMLD